MAEYKENFESDVLLEDELKEPRKFRVLLHNDDYTSMEFVVAVLMQVFRKTEEESTKIMLQVHNDGVGVCGVYTAEVAETRVEMVKQLAQQAGYPLKCTIEEV
ncbi:MULTISPECIES: ATP-dependent Clp protease adapter ClpS [Maridesulfovibrio]|uniref:ATP-dependent Clp protease adapter protein ClpS n=1 Tax=Maridesulfovibrio salexigens (strain ATCC 14822 / DSM 2638 / NCIMB 8403 / VKM B-1763) TaxID=526222 RepID=C6BTW1_MARSD|nr:MULTISPECIES: ATP-dependent Clp protease adapter ClpS [Maridesulfovibrio]ACS79891.1 ATP-dependent Clp protease adaptor protein ClpS [Maridesulfovibrio salexigens DSM 2638]HAS88760.1 ATP-dependent Clp protease adapter ClpS [Desulfovibrio sp.]